MRTIAFILFFVALFSACRFFDSNSTNDENRIKKTSDETPSNKQIANIRKGINEHEKDIFNDSMFSFVNIELLNGEFLRDHVVKTFYYDFKEWKDYHFDFFETKPDYYDFGCYLISKQTNLESEVVGIIDLRCPPLEGAYGYLFTLNKEYLIIDSIEVVRDWVAGQDGDEFYYKGETNSKIVNNQIHIERISYTCTRSDSCFMDKREYIEAKVLADGKIQIIEQKEEVYAP